MAIPSLITCTGANLDATEIAIRASWLYGCQLGKPAKGYEDRLYFADQNWKKPNRAKYMAALEKYKPHIATVLDLESYDQYDEVMSWAEEAAQWVKQVIIIPKVCGIMNDIPERIGSAEGNADVIIGYSVPTKYGGSDVPLWEFGNRPVHLLGGSPNKHFELTDYLNVVSLDGNMSMKLAVFQGSFWCLEQQKFIQLREIGIDIERPMLLAFEKSLVNIRQAWLQSDA